MCVREGDDDNMCFPSMECHAGFLQALQMKQPAAEEQKCLSGRKHKPHRQHLVHCSCINEKGKELNVKHSFHSKNEEHLVHISVFKEDIYTIQIDDTLLYIHMVILKDLLFSGGSFLRHVLAVREHNGAVMDHIHKMVEQIPYQS